MSCVHESKLWDLWAHLGETWKAEVVCKPSTASNKEMGMCTHLQFRHSL